MTQEKLASVLKKPQSFVAKVENGDRRLDVVEFCAFARGLGFDPVELFSRMAIALPDELEI